MAQTSKRTERKPKVPSASLKNTRQAPAKQMQTSKKRSKAQARISQSQVVDATAQINGDFAQVQSLLVKVRLLGEVSSSVPLTSFWTRSSGRLGTASGSATSFVAREYNTGSDRRHERPVTCLLGAAVNSLPACNGIRAVGTHHLAEASDDKLSFEACVASSRGLWTKGHPCESDSDNSLVCMYPSPGMFCPYSRKGDKLVINTTRRGIWRPCISL